ncbi:MAG: methionine--tRNA ligase, partial [Erysipelotrichales bacterium]|nr:methionine--tRNA ligase [Erysipelotrichales bacterium]
FFRMSKYADRLMKHIDTHPEFIQPESRKNEMVNNFLKPGLQDLCVSRTSFTWGVPVDFDPKHVVYVWIDALANYITGIGYDVDGSSEKYTKYWPADVHLIGKDILRFHTIYWPIMLMSLEQPLPKQVFGHPWLLMNGSKMSKSLGNVIYADDLVKLFGVDAVRYFVLHEMPFAQDGNITWELVVERVNSDLANTLGNLVSRTIAMVNKYQDGEVRLPENVKEYTESYDEELRAMGEKAFGQIAEKMKELRIADSLDVIFEFLRRCNKYVDETEPWKLGKDKSKKERLEVVLYNLLEGIRFAGVLLEPFLPETAAKIFEEIGTQNTSFDTLTWGTYETGHVLPKKVEPLFARLDAKEVIAKAEELMPKKAPALVHKPEVTIDDFGKLELRVGEVLECTKHPKADKLLVFKIDLGGEVRQVVSGLAAYYKPEELKGKKIVMIANLKPVTLRGVESQGMILTAEKDGKVQVLTSDMPIGSEIR